MANCGRCHECGTVLRTVLDGEEWCDECGAFRRYKTHGWADGDPSPCPPAAPREAEAIMYTAGDVSQLCSEDRVLPTRQAAEQYALMCSETYQLRAFGVWERETCIGIAWNGALFVPAQGVQRGR